MDVVVYQCDEARWIRMYTVARAQAQGGGGVGTLMHIETADGSGLCGKVEPGNNFARAYTSLLITHVCKQI